MTLKEFERLKAFMMMTTSSNDGEALNALRMANALIAKDNRNWQEVLEQLVSVTSEAKYEAQRAAAQPRAMSRTPDEINAALEFMLDALPPSSSFRSFMESLHAQWEARQYLTERQIEVLFNSYDKQSAGKAGWKSV
jgi:hypothetical protein